MDESGPLTPTGLRRGGGTAPDPGPTASHSDLVWMLVAEQGIVPSRGSVGWYHAIGPVPLWERRDSR